MGLPIVLLIFYVMFYPRDLFFSNQQIPENTDFELPINLNNKSSVDSLMAMKNSNFEILLANYGQPGMYKSFVWTDLNEEGELYLKAYDAIHNFELVRITERTELKVSKGESPISQEFTVYDGVWESYYLARFEVWFKPTDGTDEQKIGEQTFKVEGWIR
ncbi:hypothetical protein [Fulvivirga ligni]|uniref:hypothetical protein n=1 Tax=Fulvivirga ligni TaxID=2904246 RepID=UPI001F206C8B|nr:hypothetical protein [Fulvivirga ligni]UII20540.1 hypothetical protein LVD16_22120 [Fulvivirga ligni]